MKMNFFINPKFRSMELFIRQLPQQFSETGELIFSDNDEVRLFVEGGNEVVVKQFKLPYNIFKRLIYYHFKSRAKRVFLHAEQLLKRGFDTPQPIAHIHSSNFGFIQKNFFVSTKCPYERDFREFGDGKIAGKEGVLKDFGRLIASLHESELLLESYSPGNIAFEVTPEGTKFMLLNIRHIKYKHIGRSTGIDSFLNFAGSNEMLEVVFREYAMMRGFDANKYIEKLIVKRHIHQNISEKIEEREFKFYLRLKRSRKINSF